MSSFIPFYTHSLLYGNILAPKSSFLNQQTVLNINNKLILTFFELLEALAISVLNILLAVSHINLLVVRKSRSFTRKEIWAIVNTQSQEVVKKKVIQILYKKTKRKKEKQNIRIKIQRNTIQKIQKDLAEASQVSFYVA